MSDEPTAGTATPDAQDPGPGDDVEGLPGPGAGHDAPDPHAGGDAHDAHGGHGGPSLGPIDWRAYGAGILGAALGLAVAAVLAVTTGYVVL